MLNPGSGSSGSSYPVEPYNYLSLNKARHETRTFVIDTAESAARPDLLSFRLTHVSLDETSRFYAISYACGDVQKKKPVIVNGCLIFIYESLETALRTITRRFPSRVLWADAISINQQDVDEKAYQVAQLGMVYSQAQLVMIWLGLETPELKEACYGLTFFEAECRIRLLESLLNGDFAYLLGFRTESSVTYRRSADPLSHRTRVTEPMLDIVKQMFALPWWERVWTLQEYVLCRDAEFMCGDTIVTSTTMSSALAQIEAVLLAGTWENARVSALGPYEEIAQDIDRWFQYRISLRYCLDRSKAVRLREQREVPTGLPKLRKLLQLTVGWDNLELDSLSSGDTTLKTTDPRDRIYATIGMAADRLEIGIEPDYTKSCDALYAELTRSILNRGDTTVLTYANCSAALNDIPSWVVNWSRPLKQPLMPSNENGSDVRYSATGSSSLVTEAGQSNPHILSISGYLVDRVTFIVEPAFPMKSSFTLDQSSDARNPEIVTRGIFEVLTALRSHLEHLEGHSEAKIGACAMTIVAGNSFNSARNHWEQANVRDSVTAYKELEWWISSEPTRSMSQLLENYWASISHSAIRRRLFFTESGRLGLGPLDTKIGDHVVLFHGAESAFVVRPLLEVDGTQQYRLVGETYVHGIMYGEYLTTDPASVFIHLV